MSSLNECNFCTLRNIKANADIKGLIVTVLPDHAGHSVYVHPDNVEIDESNKETYWVAWLMKIPNHCCC